MTRMLGEPLVGGSTLPRAGSPRSSPSRPSRAIDSSSKNVERDTTPKSPRHEIKASHPTSGPKQMSLAIDIHKVSAVLLADGWHEVTDASFHLAAYEWLGSGGTQQGDGSLGYGF